MAATAMYLRPAALRSVQGLGHAGVPTGIGLGWIEINGDDGPARIVQKTGGGAGFQTYVALNPARHVGVFVAATQGRNRSGANLFRETNALLIQMAGLPPVPVDVDDPEREREPEEANDAVMRAPLPRRHEKATARVKATTSHGVVRTHTKTAAPREVAVPRKGLNVRGKRAPARAAKSKAVVKPVRRRR